MAGHRQRVRANCYLTVEFSFHSAAAASQLIVDAIPEKGAISERFRVGIGLTTTLSNRTEREIAQRAPTGPKVHVNSFRGRCRLLQSHTLWKCNLVVHSGQLKKI